MLSTLDASEDVGSPNASRGATFGRPASPHVSVANTLPAASRSTRACLRGGGRRLCQPRGSYAFAISSWSRAWRSRQSELRDNPATARPPDCGAHVVNAAVHPLLSRVAGPRVARQLFLCHRRTPTALFCSASCVHPGQTGRYSIEQNRHKCQRHMVRKVLSTHVSSLARGSGTRRRSARAYSRGCPSPCGQTEDGAFSRRAQTRTHRPHGANCGGCCGDREVGARPCARREIERGIRTAQRQRRAGPHAHVPANSLAVMPSLNGTCCPVTLQKTSASTIGWSVDCALRSSRES